MNSDPQTRSIHLSADATLVIVGAGMAGGELAYQARQQGWAGKIILLGEHAHLPYHRPMLSKTYLTGKASVDALPMRAATAYDTAHIDVCLHQTVVQVDRAQRAVLLQDGSRMTYDVLALCTGGLARTWSCDGVPLHADNLYTLRTREDADALRTRLRPDAHLAVIGGGYIGLEVAASARSLGVNVTLLEAQDRLLARSASAPLAAFLADRHRVHGVDIRTASPVLGVQYDAQGKIAGLRCADGQTLAVDTVLAGIGMQPNIQLARDAGLDIDVGIVVDVNGRTSDRQIFAAGDCTVHRSARYGRSIRLESVPNALEQARAAASAICGKPRVHHAVPWFWSDQYDVKLQLAGLTHEHDTAVSRGSLAQGQCITFIAYWQSKR